jgi:hypothetical protein
MSGYKLHVMYTTREGNVLVVAPNYFWLLWAAYASSIFLFALWTNGRASSLATYAFRVGKSSWFIFAYWMARSQPWKARSAMLHADQGNQSRLSIGQETSS